jgi:hypothetical protein
VAKDRLPKRAAQVFVEQERKRHSLTDVRFGLWRLGLGKSIAERAQIDSAGVSLLLVHGSGASVKISINIVLII